MKGPHEFMVIPILKQNQCLTPIHTVSWPSYLSFCWLWNFPSLCHCLCCTCDELKLDVVFKASLTAYTSVLHFLSLAAGNYFYFLQTPHINSHHRLPGIVICLLSTTKPLSSLRKESENRIYPCISYGTLCNFLHI